MNSLQVEEKLRAFLSEDIGHADITSDAIFSTAYIGEAKVISKESGVFSGAHLIQHVYQLLSTDIEVTLHKHDQDLIESGELLATISGPVHIILTGERVMLNLLQLMSGIATATHEAIKTLNNSSIRICDTRKTDSDCLKSMQLLAVEALTTGTVFMMAS